jgi:cbb3-type cytochrome oxidase subunit 3
MRLSDIMGHAGLAIYAEIALILFLLVFLMVTVRMLRAPRREMDRQARLPLEDDDPSSAPSEKP